MVPFLAAALAFVAAAVGTALAVLIGAGRGLNTTVAAASLVVGVAAGVAAFVQTRCLPSNESVAGKVSPWAWLAFVAFALFALRSFCWLVYEDAAHDGVHARLEIGNTNNLGDISLHIQYARDFANGTPWWPEHPQAGGYAMRYYPGIDLFQALGLVLGADELPALVWVGLAGSLLSALALYRWGGAFAVAGFLFAGGLAGFGWFRSGTALVDFQAEMAWKSLPLAIFVTQRPFLFALPAGLLLLAHWRDKFFTDPAAPPERRGLIPFWVEWLLYALMPAFHVFAFLFLSMLLGGWFLACLDRAPLRRHLLTLVAAALLPASGLVYLMTDHFHAGSNITYQPGWMQHDQNFFKFWLLNFGGFALLAPALWLWCLWTVVRLTLELDKTPRTTDRELANAAAFVLPAGLLFLAACLWLFAPWEWDNTKLMIWCYLAVLPFVWERFVRPWPVGVRAAVCTVLFFSGAASLAGGLGKGDSRLGLIDMDELSSVRVIVRDLPAEGRFAAVPDYNHPLVYCGRKVAMGYNGHLHSQGIDYAPLARDLDTLMNGQPDWREAAARLHVRYVFWGPREIKRYPDSSHPWADPGEPVAAGEFGTVYDLDPAAAPR